MKPTGTAVVGVGYWGPGIVRNLAALPSATLLHLVDQDTQRANEVGQRLAPGVPAHGNFQQVLDDPEVEAVVLATPVRTHYALAHQALSAGKHVLVEKPLAMSTRECLELEALAQEKSLVLMVGHVFLFNAGVRHIKRYLEEGELGQVLYVHSRRVNLGRVQGDINALWSFAPHDLSILQYWLGCPPVAIQARGFSYIQPGVEDVVFCTLEYPGGIGAHLHLGWLDPRKVRELTVVGSDKMVVFDDVATDAKVRLFDSRIRSNPNPAGPEDFASWQVDIRHGDVTLPELEWVEPLRAEVSHFVDCIQQGVPCLASGAEGRAVTQAIEAAQESLRRGGSRVLLEEINHD